MGQLYNSKGEKASWSELPEIVACDIETTGLDYAYDDINIIQVGTSGEQYYTDEIDIETFKELEKHKLIFHNGKFDTKFLANKFGKLLDIYGDTMVMLHAMGWSESFGLKDSASKILHVENWDIDVDIKQGMTPEMIQYALKDVKYTYMLADRLLEKMDDTDFKVYTNELRAYSAFRMVELTGTYIGNIDKSDAIIEKMLLEKELEIGLNLDWVGSTKKLGKLLYDGMGLPVLARTSKGAPSTARNILQDLGKSEKFCNDLVEFTKTKKLRQFFASWRKLQIDGKIRPQFNIMARTGRTTSSNPNLQQVPQNSYVRNMITAPPGWKFIECDYSQLELRCASFCAQDPVMQHAYKHNEDLHAKTTYMLFGDTSNLSHDEQKRKRTQAKSCNFGLLYGMSAKSLCEYAKGMGVEMTPEEATEYRNKFFEGYPRLVSWHNECIQFAESFGYSQTPGGRKRYLPDIFSTNFSKRSSAQRQSINSPVQGLGSDICVSALTKITEHPEYGNTFLIYGTVHDAILVIAKDDFVEHVAYDIIEKTMENPPVLKDIPGSDTLYLKADVEIGQSWGGGTNTWKQRD